MQEKTIRIFHAGFQEMLHFGYQLNVLYKFITTVKKLFYRDGILKKKKSYAIRILLSCHLDYLVLK